MSIPERAPPDGALLGRGLIHVRERLFQIEVVISCVQAVLSNKLDDFFPKPCSDILGPYHGDMAAK